MIATEKRIKYLFNIVTDFVGVQYHLCRTMMCDASGTFNYQTMRFSQESHFIQHVNV